MEALLQQLVGRREPSISPSSSPHPERRSRPESDGVERDQPQPIQQPRLPTHGDASRIDEESIVVAGDSHVGPSPDPEGKADNRKARLHVLTR